MIINPKCYNGISIGDIPIPYKKVESIYDIPYSEIEAICRQAMNACFFIEKDVMTRGELYNCIESIFQEYLGEDFLKSHIIYGDQSIAYTFFRMTFNGLSKPDNGHQVYIEAKGYTHMSETEMRAVLRSKYPDVMTLRSSILMSYELWRLGLEATSYGGIARENIFSTLAVNGGDKADTPAFATESREIYEYMLDLPVSFEDMKASIEAFRGSNGYLHFIHNVAYSVDEMLVELFSFTGVNVNNEYIVNKLSKYFYTDQNK